MSQWVRMPIATPDDLSPIPVTHMAEGLPQLYSGLHTVNMYRYIDIDYIVYKYMNVCVCVCMHVPYSTHGAQKTTMWSWFSPSLHGFQE